MRRRNFIKDSLSVAGVMATSVSAVAASSLNAGASTFRLNYAPHEGMFAAHAGKNFVDQIKFMADQGFRSIEDNGFLGRSKTEQEQIARTLSDLKMTMGVFVIDGGDNWKISLTTGKKEFIDNFVNTCQRSVEAAKLLNAKWMTVVPGFFERKLPLDIQTEIGRAHV